MSLFLTKIPKTVTIRWIPANPQRIQVGHPWVHLDGSDDVRGLAPTCARNPPCISSLVTETSGVTSVMSTIVGATAGWGSHMLAVYYMLTGLLRCWHVRSSHVASGVTVTWLVRTDGFFATSRDTTSLDPGDQSRTQIFEHRSPTHDPLRSSDFFVVACPSWNLHC